MWSIPCLCGFGFFCCHLLLGQFSAHLQLTRAPMAHSFLARRWRDLTLSPYIWLIRGVRECAHAAHHLAQVANNIYRELAWSHASPAASVKTCFTACMELGSGWATFCHWFSWHFHSLLAWLTEWHLNFTWFLIAMSRVSSLALTPVKLLTFI